MVTEVLQSVLILQAQVNVAESVSIHRCHDFFFAVLPESPAADQLIYSDVAIATVAIATAVGVIGVLCAIILVYIVVLKIRR